MHIGRHIVQELVLEFGDPVVERWDVPLTEPEFRGVQQHLDHGRAHDVSLVIRKGSEVAVIRKRGYPEDGYRIPSGGIHPEESFVDGASREALEETGLTIHMKDYLLQIHASFTCEGERAPWTTHVMVATADDGEIAPHDHEEIESARWMDFSDLIHKVNPLLEKSGLGGLRYRARLHERVAELLAGDRVRGG